MQKYSSYLFFYSKILLLNLKENSISPIYRVK